MWLNLTFLTLATLITWLWTTTESLSFYTLQLIGLLILIYFIKNIWKIPPSEESAKPTPQRSDFNTKHIDSLILTMVVLLLIFSTGGLASPLFFLTYFLLFGISFLFEPKLAIIYSLILISFFAVQLDLTASEQLLKLISILFVSPLALFFGQQFLQNLADKKRIRIYQKKWLDNEKFLENQETSALLWLSLNFKELTAEIIEICALLLTQTSSLSPHQQDSVRKIKQKAERLLNEGDKLKVKIDEETDSAPAESSN